MAFLRNKLFYSPQAFFPRIMWLPGWGRGEGGKRRRISPMGGPYGALGGMPIGGGGGMPGGRGARA